ncbi:MAG: M20 family metallo-hydrolase [Calditrichaceae bacterium]
MENTQDKKVFDKIDALETDAIELMKAIVPIKALGPLNDGEGEKAKAEYIEQYLKKIGFTDIKKFPAKDDSVPGGERPNLAAVLEGKNDDKTIWILAHLDVVPEGDRSKWDTDPFEVTVKSGKLYGRGTEDNNQGLVSGIIAAKALIDLNIQPNYNLGLMIVSDEETGSIYGLQHMVDNHGELFKKDDLIIVPDAGEPDSKMIEVAEKSILWLKFKTVGKQVHASTPEKGINAFNAASHLVVALNKLHDIFGARDKVFDPPISTFEATRKEANVPNVNTIPGEDVFYLDCRILPVYTIEQVMKEAEKISRNIEQKFKVKIEISIAQKDPAAPPTSAEAPVVKALQTAVKAVYNVDAAPMGIGGGTVAAIFRRAGYPAAVWSTIDDLAHQPNEYCVISSMMNDARVFAHVCLNA